MREREMREREKREEREMRERERDMVDDVLSSAIS